MKTDLLVTRPGWGKVQLSPKIFLKISVHIPARRLVQETFWICIFMNSTNHSTASTFNTRARMSCQQKVAKKPVSSNALQETNGYCFEQPDKRVPKVLFRGHRQMNFQLGRLLVSSRADGGGNLAEALICRWERWLVVFLLAATPSYRSSSGRI